MSAKLGVSRRPRWSVLLVFVAVIAFAGIVYFGATKLEESDAFCTSCHSEPESTYFNRAQANPATDLASLHAHLSQLNPKAENTRCIDCHAGPGISGRVDALAIGARDAVRWFSGRARQPAITTVALDDANCLKCHGAIPAATGFDAHFHRYMARWQQSDPANAGRCITCHTSHTLNGSANLGFLQQQRTQAVCDACHIALIPKR